MPFSAKFLRVAKQMRVLILIAGFLVALTGAAQTSEQRLFDALEADKPLVAEGIVARGKLDLNARNKERETPLHRAIEKGYKELAAMLVKAGARLNALNQTGETPLHYAALYSDTYFVDLLLNAKANPKARNDDGESALQWAVMTGNPQTAKHLLLGGADLKATDLKGNTLLHA